MCKRLQPLKFIKDIRDKQNNENYTVEMMANMILNGCGIEEAPIDIDKIAKTIGFKLYLTPEFTSKNYSAFITDRDSEIYKLGTGNMIVVKKTESTEIKRIWQSICICHYILYANEDKNYNKTFSYDQIITESKSKEEILARALLMPQKELSMYINSPLLRNIKGQELLKNISKAFMVPEETAQLRLSEAGFEL